MRILLSLAIFMTAFASQAQSVKLDAPEVAKVHCAARGTAYDVLWLNVNLVIKKANTTRVILSLVDADCINGKPVPSPSNNFFTPSLQDMNGENAIVSQPTIARVNRYTHQVVLEFYTDQLAHRERQFLLSLPVHNGSYTVYVITSEDGTAQVQPN
ncbi:hypothetical protein EZJ49_11800 [Bdellovibrio bacteriovorus]|uniref:hypothetical protein n=1 Tax=Bdellovibrio bacteriovorus TaxID=959 RepID=UPI0021D1828D|nr:hypothetical protein [Bdellovibrio bacteriovorus]UXR63749.1 hypothetical protein EZJ49_11800 [Bdellovibrio bacteriovorus]